MARGGIGVPVRSDESAALIELPASPIYYFSGIPMPVLEVPDSFQSISLPLLSMHLVAGNSAVTQTSAQLQAEHAERLGQINAFSNLSQAVTPWWNHHFAPASESSPGWDATVNSSNCAAPAA